MGHQQHISSFVVLVMQSEIIDLAQVRSSSYDISAMLEKIGTESLNEAVDLRFLRAWSYSGIELRGD